MAKRQKYTEADYQIVMRMADDGWGARAIAKETGVPRSTAQNWIDGNSRPSSKPTTSRRRSSPQARVTRSSSPKSSPHFIGTATPFKSAQDVVRRADTPASNPAALTVRQPNTMQRAYANAPDIDYDVARITGEQRAAALRRMQPNNSTALAKPEPKTLWEKALASDNPITFLFLAIAAGLQKIGRTMFGGSEPAPATNHRLLTTGNQLQNFSQTGISSHPEYGANGINGLSSPNPLLEWNSQAGYGLTAQQAYGNNLMPYETDYYTCDHCGHAHVNGDGCAWNGYR